MLPGVADNLGMDVRRSVSVLESSVCNPKKIGARHTFCVNLSLHWKEKKQEQGITNTLALPIDNLLHIYVLCPHSEHQNNPFQSKKSKNFYQRNRFTKCETGSIKVKLPKVGSSVMVPVPVGAGPDKYGGKKEDKGIQEGRGGKPRGLCQG
jgi:hypothetical protein